MTTMMKPLLKNQKDEIFTQTKTNLQEAKKK